MRSNFFLKSEIDSVFSGLKRLNLRAAWFVIFCFSQFVLGAERCRFLLWRVLWWWMALFCLKLKSMVLWRHVKMKTYRWTTVCDLSKSGIYFAYLVFSLSSAWRDYVVSIRPVGTNLNWGPSWLYGGKLLWVEKLFDVWGSRDIVPRKVLKIWTSSNAILAHCGTLSRCFLLTLSGNLKAISDSYILFQN